MKQVVCLFTDSLEPSGMGIHMLTLATELRKQYHLAFVCPPSPTGLPLLTRARALGCQILAAEVRGEAAAQARLCDWLQAQAVAVFHCHAGIGWEGHQGIYAAREAGVPVVIRTEHLPDLITDPYERAAYNRMLQAVDRVICVSEEAYASFLAAGVPQRQVRLVRNGIYLHSGQPDRQGVRARLGLPPRSRLVLTVARMTEQKGHRHLLETAPAVVERRPEAYFVWVGSGPLEDDLREQAHALGLDEHVRFVGQRADVTDLMAAADLFVLPSLFEGLPLAVLEAMAAGLPVVGTRICGTAEAVRDGVTGRLVEAGDAPALAAAILEVLDQPDMAAHWGAAGRQRVQQEFSAARMARDTAAIYEEALAETGRSDEERSPSPHSPLPAAAWHATAALQSDWHAS
jgi:glycosyltransferase involved in cell wall biosynthesis